MKVLNSSNLLVRIGFLWIIGFLLMFIAWDISYRSIPEGIARGKFLISYIKLDMVKVFVTFTQIFAYNFFLVGLPITLANLVRLKNLPLGYLLSLYHWIMYGIFLGTNSFLIPSASKLTPTLQIFNSSAIYEITAYSFIAASTYRIKTYQMTSRAIFNFKWRIGGLTRSELATFISAGIILALSNYIEASQIVSLK